MNPTDEINARIQDIAARIREIQSLGRRPPGQSADSGTVKHPAAYPTGSAATADGSTVTPDLSSAAGSGTSSSPAFQSLLEQALSSPSDSTSSGTDQTLGLSGLGDLGSMDSLLGAGSPQSSSILGSDNDARLQNYQKLLLQAIQELRAQKGGGAPGNTP